MKIIENTLFPPKRLEQAEFAVSVDPHQLWTMGRPGDVTAFGVASSYRPSLDRSFPKFNADYIKKCTDHGFRVMLGNASLELSFCQFYKNDPKVEWVDCLIEWADKAYALAGDKLVLAPFEIDISYDISQGCRFLCWAVEHRVPLAIYNGFMLLFTKAERQELLRDWGVENGGMAQQYPFDEISQAIKETGAEVWTGAGFHQGLEKGSFEKAQRFGFQGIFTQRDVWERFFTRRKILYDNA